MSRVRIFSAAVLVGALAGGALVFLETSASGAAGAASGLIGTWRLVEARGVAGDDWPGGAGVDRAGRGGEAGVMVVGAGRLTTMVAPAGIGVGPVLSYTGSWRVDGDRLVTRVDLASLPGWSGGEQVRRFALEGDRLETSVAEGARGAGPTLVWQREK